MNSESKFKGGMVALGCFIIVFVNLGLASTIGITIPYLIEATGGTLSQVSLTITVATICSFIASFLIPKVIGKFGVKGTLYLCLLLLIPYMLFSGFANAIWMLYIHGMFGGFFLCWGTNATASIMISKWYIEKRSTMLGIVLGGGAFGAAVFQMLAGVLCEKYNVTICYIVILVIGLVVPGLANMLLLKEPEQVGQKPLGWEKAEADSGSSKELLGLTFEEAKASPLFWLCLLAILLTGPLITGFQSFASSYWRSYGMDPGAASTYVSIFSAIGCVAVIVLGRVANRYGNKIYMTIICVSYIIGMIFASLWPTNMSTAYLAGAIIFCGISYPLTNAVPSTIATETFGPREYTKIISWMSAMLYLGKAVASPLISTIVAKAAGGFVTAFIVLMIMCAISLVIILGVITASPYQKMLKAKQS